MVATVATARHHWASWSAVGFMACAVVLVWGASAYYWKLLNERQASEVAAARAAIEVRTRQLTDAVGLESDATLRGIDTALRFLRAVHSRDPGHFKQAAADVLNAYPPGALRGVLLLDGVGRLKWASESGPSSALAQAAASFGGASRAAAGEGSDRLLIEAPFLDDHHSEPLLLLTRPLPNQAGWMGLVLQQRYLQGQLRAVRGGAQDGVALVRADGVLLAHSREAGRRTGLRVPSDWPFVAASAPDRGVFRAASMFDGKEVLSGWLSLDDFSVRVHTFIDESVDLVPLAQQHALQRYQTAATILIVNWLILTMLVMLVRIYGQKRHLQSSEARYRSLFEKAKVPILLIQSECGRIFDANTAASAYYGYGRAELRGMNISDINTLSREQVLCEMAEARSEQRDCFYFSHRLRSGDIRQVEVRSGPLEINGKELVYSIIQDVTDRQAFEAALFEETARLRALMDTASDGIHVVDLDGKLVEHSLSFASMLGYAGHDLRGMNMVDWMDDVQPEDVRALISSFGRDPVCFEARHRRRDGTLIQAEVVAKRVTIGDKVLAYCSSRDISERKKTEEDMRVAATAFETQEGMMITDADFRIVRVNRAFTAITGYQADEVVGQLPSLLNAEHQGGAFYAAMLRELPQEGAWQGEVWNRRKSGELYPEWLAITAVRGAGGEVTHYVWTLTDITGRKAAEDEIRHLAFYDGLTQLPNRRLLNDRLARAVAGSQRSGRLGAVLFIDLDNFKMINDSLGHEAGDRLLQQVSARLVEAVREQDTVARLGGDEFVVMLEDLESVANEAADHVRKIAEKLLGALNQSFDVAGHWVHSSASIGVALFHGHGDSADELLKRADVAMYEAKAAGRNAVRFFDPRMQASVSQRMALESDLRAGLVQEQFELHYQPQVDGAGRLIASEVLVRWRHPARGLVAPDEFIRLAEESGLIRTLGRWVMWAACQQLAKWAGLAAFCHLGVAVNVSARQFAQDDFVEQVEEILRATQANAALLKLELTESILVDSADVVRSKMERLRRLGVTFSLDDFGTGYSSLAYLSSLPLDQLKIDKSFVADLEHSDAAAAICAAIVSLAHNLHLKVVAEGVETQAQSDFLRAELHCDYQQGYLFGAPLSLQAFEDFVQQRTQARIEVLV